MATDSLLIKNFLPKYFLTSFRRKHFSRHEVYYDIISQGPSKFPKI